MNTRENDPKLKKLEEALKKSYSADVAVDRTFEKNLDKLVENTIKSQKLDRHVQLLNHTSTQKKSFFSMIFSGAKWQAAFLTSFLGILLLGTVAFAAVPALREVIIPTKGNLYINSEPNNAQIFLKGGEYDEYTLVGTTPLKEKIKSGNYEMRLALKDYEEYSTTFKLEARKSVNLEIRLKKENPILDTIKEWKTYTDLEDGFEFTYPLSWTLKTTQDQDSDFVGVEVTGENSKLQVYSQILDIEEASIRIEINDKEYTGLRDQQEWKFILFDEYTSKDGSNSIKTAFYTNQEEEVEIYDFIKSSVKVYNQDEIQQSTNWTTYTHESLGFRFSYPNDWVVIERERTPYIAKYEIRPIRIQSSTETLQIIYSTGYYSDFNDYEFYQASWINGLEIDQYLSGSCDGKFLYEFPNRIYIVNQTSDDQELNDTNAQIINSMIIFLENKYPTISNYSWNYSVTIPNDWSYTQVSDETIFDGKTHIALTNSFGTIRIFSWPDVENLWKWYKEDRHLDKAHLRSSSIKIEGRESMRNEAWTGGKLASVIYTSNVFGEDVSQWDPKVTIGISQFFVIFEGDITTYDLNNVSQEVEVNLSIVDSIVASLEGIEK